MINGKTTMVGVMGYPVGHSLSPAMHNAAFQALGMDWCYVPFPVNPAAIEAAVRGLAALGFRGANATIPHKQALIPLLDEIAPAARALGAANTLIIDRKEDGNVRLSGDNTDVEGFLVSLKQGGFSLLPESRVILAGAGGAARGVLYGLYRQGVRQVTIINQTLARATQLAADIQVLFPDLPLAKTLPLSREILEMSLDGADLFINTTPLGMYPKVDACVLPEDMRLPPNLTVYDLVYNPVETRLLQMARRQGLPVINGVEMLVVQGALSFQMWTGVFPPLDVMRNAVVDGLTGRR